MNTGNGDAPCSNCGKHIWNIPLDMDDKESDGEGGFWFRVATDSKCLECGQDLVWFHVGKPTLFQDIFGISKELVIKNK